MSLYDRAKVFFSAAAGAGGEGVAYNIKPEEKLKVDEYIENGGFDTDSVWIKNTHAGQEATISGGKGRLVGDGSAFTSLQQNDVFEADKVYKVSLEAEIREGELKVQSNGYDGNIGLISKSGKHSFYFTGISGSPHLVLGRRRLNVDFDIEVDNVSVREVEQKANDFSFVRASDLTATYEGPDGLIKKTRENLIEYSNDFSKWTYNPSVHNAPVSGQTGYDGSTDAWLIDKVTSDNSYLILPTPFNYTGVFTWSMYAKNESGANNGLHMYTPAGQAKFDLTGSGSVVSPSYANISATIESIGSGWFRCSFAAEGTFTTTNQPRFKVVDTAGDNSTGKIYVQHAQLEQGLAATPYIHRTDSFSKSTAGIQEDEPRYDYSLDNALPPVLMLEPERTNKINYSEYFEGSGWTVNGNGTGLDAVVTTNYAVSPDGSKNAARLQLDLDGGTTNNDRSRIKIDAGSYSSGDQTNSIYIKANDGNTHTITFRGLLSIETFSVGSAWKRIDVSGDAVDNGAFFELGIYGNTTAYDTADLCIWGAQMENGPYATSYIPTYGSSRTREGEAHSSLSSFRCELDKPLTKKYTFVVDVRVDNLERPTTNFDDIFVARSQGALFTDYPFRIEGYYNPNVNPVTYSLRVFSYKVGDTGSGTTTPHTNGIQLGVRNKIAIVFDEDSGIKIFVNGNSTPMAESTEPGQMHDVHFLEGGGNPRSKTFLYGVQAYDEALSDEECVSLTTIS